MSTPTWLKYIRDIVLFAIGAAIVLKQAGLLPPDYQPPTGGPSVVLLVVGALFCNGPLMLQALPMLFRSGSSSPPEALPPAPVQPSGPSSAPSSGGE